MLHFGEDLPYKISESKKASKRTSHSQFQYSQNKGYNQKQKESRQLKNDFLYLDNKHKIQNRSHC